MGIFEGKFQSANISLVPCSSFVARKPPPVPVRLPFPRNLRLFNAGRREKKNRIFSKVSNIKFSITVVGTIASLCVPGRIASLCHPLVEKKKKIDFLSRFPKQNILYPISLIRLKINKYVIIHIKI